MAKYVCDVEAVISAGEGIKTVAGNISTSVTTYAQNSETALSGWNGGPAKRSYSSAANAQAQKTQTDAEYIEALGQFAVDAAKAIQALEEELAGFDI